MPIDPDGLLDLAIRLVQENASEADLRRGISTAYYALFHLLIANTMEQVIGDAALRPKVARAMQHGAMKSVADRYKSAKEYDGILRVQGASPLVISNHLHQVASTFHALQEAREEADYDSDNQIEFTHALAFVEQAREAFIAWEKAQSADPSATTFIRELFLGMISRRNR